MPVDAIAGIDERASAVGTRAGVGDGRRRRGEARRSRATRRRRTGADGAPPRSRAVDGRVVEGGGDAVTESEPDERAAPTDPGVGGQGTDADDDHLRELPDGAGCVEIWEYLSEDSADGDADDAEE